MDDQEIRGVLSRNVDDYSIFHTGARFHNPRAFTPREKEIAEKDFEGFLERLKLDLLQKAMKRLHHGQNLHTMYMNFVDFHPQTKEKLIDSYLIIATEKMGAGVGDVCLAEPMPQHERDKRLKTLKPVAHPDFNHPWEDPRDHRFTPLFWIVRGYTDICHPEFVAYEPGKVPTILATTHERTFVYLKKTH